MEVIPDAEDIRVLENNTYKHLKDGCKDCGFLQIVFQAAISVGIFSFCRMSFMWRELQRYYGNEGNK